MRLFLHKLSSFDKACARHKLRRRNKVEIFMYNPSITREIYIEGAGVQGRINMDILGKVFGEKTAVPLHPMRETQFDMPLKMENIERIFEGCYDFEKRMVDIGGNQNARVYLCFVDGLVSSGIISESIIKPLTSERRFGGISDSGAVIDMMLGGTVYNYASKKRDKMDDVISDLLNGFCAIIFEDENAAVTFEVRSAEKRSISEPKEEKAIKGAKDAFIELMKVNTTLVRRKLCDPNLKIKKVSVGRHSKTIVGIAYIKNLTNMEFVEEVERRLGQIDTDGILTAGVLEEYIVDRPYSPFPQLIRTERPDKFSMGLLDGRVGIFIDGLPMGFLTPATLGQFLKVAEDMSNHYLIASGLTALRYISMLITIVFPAFYVAIALYHQEMLPTKLMQSIIVSKQSVPFPTAIEVLAMLAAFELLQEAGIRLPEPIGQTVSIIGALIVGQSAVEAKVVSPIVVIVIALAGIAGYTMPNQDMGAALRIWRFLLVISAIIGGIYGMAVGGGLLIYHLCSLESFGVAYLAPFVGKTNGRVLQELFRWPTFLVKTRDPILKPKNVRKQK